MTNKPIAIIGAGNGGQTTAAWLANQGYKTRIFDVMEDTVAKLNELGGVNIYGNTDYPGFGKIEFATTDMEKAIEGCELILLILPENYHDSIAVKMAPYLKDGQIVVLNPASGLGAISFKKALTDAGCTADVPRLDGHAQLADQYLRLFCGGAGLPGVPQLRPAQ